jgi:hypothetical protein
MGLGILEVSSILHMIRAWDPGYTGPLIEPSFVKV